MARVDLTGTPAEVEAKIERMHRFVGWISLDRLANKGQVRWEGKEKYNWWIIVVFFFVVLVLKCVTSYVTLEL